MTEQPNPGLWSLIGPDGKTYHGSTPVQCAIQGLRSRIPAEQQIKNLQHALYGVCDRCEDDITGVSYWLAKDTPAEIGPLCLSCRNTIMADSGRIVEGLQEENAELRNTIDMVQSRIERVTKAWQEETGKTSILPDLGALISWGLERN